MTCRSGHLRGRCAVCDNPADFKCHGWYSAFYCNADCQRIGWEKGHALQCQDADDSDEEVGTSLLSPLSPTKAPPILFALQHKPGLK